MFAVYSQPVMSEPYNSEEVSGLLHVIFMRCSKMFDLLNGGNVI